MYQSNSNELLACHLQDHYNRRHCEQCAQDVSLDLRMMCLKEFFRTNPDMLQIVSQPGWIGNIDSPQLQYG